MKFYDDSFKILTEKASRIVQVPSFVMNEMVYVKTKGDLKVMDYFDVPMVPQQGGAAYKGRVRLNLKWLVKTTNGFFVKPKILCFYLLYKY